MHLCCSGAGSLQKDTGGSPEKEDANKKGERSDLESTERKRGLNETTRLKEQVILSLCSPRNILSNNF